MKNQKKNICFDPKLFLGIIPSTGKAPLLRIGRRCDQGRSSRHRKQTEIGRLKKIKFEIGTNISRYQILARYFFRKFEKQLKLKKNRIY